MQSGALILIPYFAVLRKGINLKPFVLTGASGGGKSTLLAALANRGFKTQPEIGRTLVEEQRALGGTALPWTDPVAFRDTLFQRSLEAFDQHKKTADEVVIFDRSFLEAIAYPRLIDEDVPVHFTAEAGKRRFRDPVFVCPPWKEIFRQDAERQHDFEYACRDHEVNVATYLEYGFRIIELPKTTVGSRMEIVERTITGVI